MASMVTSTHQAEPCHLLGLPPELRLRIYDFLYPTRDVHMYYEHTKLHCWTVETIDQTGENLLRTCRQIYWEARKIFRDSLRYVFQPITRRLLHGYYEGFALSYSLLNSRVSRLSKSIAIFAGTGDDPHFDIDLATVAKLLENLEYCESVQRLDVVIEWDYGDDLRNIDRLINLFRTLACTGKVQLEIRYWRPSLIPELHSECATLEYFGVQYGNKDIFNKLLDFLGAQETTRWTEAEKHICPYPPGTFDRSLDDEDSSSLGGEDESVSEEEDEVPAESAGDGPLDGEDEAASGSEGGEDGDDEE